MSLIMRKLYLRKCRFCIATSAKVRLCYILINILNLLIYCPHPNFNHHMLLSPKIYIVIWISFKQKGSDNTSLGHMSSLLHEYFSRFLKYSNSTKSRKASHSITTQQKSQCKFVLIVFLMIFLGQCHSHLPKIRTEMYDCHVLLNFYLYLCWI